jgi:hypothetical protein
MKTLLTACVEELAVELGRFPWTNRDAYGDWLAQTYYYVRHSTRLLAASATRFAFDDRGNALHHRFAAHMDEEKKHELLATHDLKGMSFRLEDFSERHSTRMFYETQYYKIEHQDPSALFGYILALEAMSAAHGKRITETVAAAFGDKCISFLRLHGEDDVDHLAKGLAAVEAASPDQRALIEQNLRQSTYAYCELLADIRRSRV